jgi:hypothetical protein
LLLLLLSGCTECGSGGLSLPDTDAGIFEPPVECDCASVPLPPTVRRLEAVEVDGACVCRVAECADRYELIAGGCFEVGTGCYEDHRKEGSSCVPAEDLGCDEAPNVPRCIPNSESPREPQGCIEGCHDQIEDAHPWFGGPALSCTGCHGGDPIVTTREEAHVSIPDGLHGFNVLTLAGVESFAGGLEWLRFRNPGDLRIADLTCGKAGCHPEHVEYVRRSIMATAAGIFDGALAQSGVARATVRDGGAIYKWDATRGMTFGRSTLDALWLPPRVGAVPHLERLSPKNRETAAGWNETDLLIDLYDKACGDCHLGAAGAAQRHASFRSSGCSACHVVYRLDGRSFSRDEMIRKDEPTYPQAYLQIAESERPHPSTHRIVRSVGSRRCGTCHSGSNHTEKQFRGQQIDPNRTAAKSLPPHRVSFTHDLPEELGPLARYHGLAREQILDFVDWDDDGLSDIPADVHAVAGLECIDCHGGDEMHGRTSAGAGAIWSRMDQATDVECADCHGTLEQRALARGELIVCPENRETIVGYEPPPECSQLGRGRWLRSKLGGRYHYVVQTFDTARPPPNDGSGATAPNGGPIYTENAEIFHARSAGGFTHLDGLECYACHATWANNCYGCHLRFSDAEGGEILRDHSRATGALTLGRVVRADVDAISPLDLQYGINAEGQIAQLLPEAKQHVSFDGDPSPRVYRHRSGYGLRTYATEPVGLPPGKDGPLYDQDPRMDANAGGGAQPFMPHTVQRSHPRMDCTSCHLDPSRSNEDAIAARWGYNPLGFAGVSAYLERAQTIFDRRTGFRFTEPVLQQADWCVDRETGFPYCASNHPMRVDVLPPYRRDYPGTLTLDARTAGPITLKLIQKLESITVEDVGVQYRGPR